MSERIHVSCATENEVMDSCCVSRVKSLVAIECRGLKMEFIPSDAARLGKLMVEFAENAGWHNPEADDGR